MTLQKLIKYYMPTRYYGHEARRNAKFVAIEHLKQFTNLEQVTRVEVIDENGRNYVNWQKDNQVQTSLQDDGRTLKIFITQKS